MGFWLVSGCLLLFPNLGKTTISVLHPLGGFASSRMHASKIWYTKSEPYYKLQIFDQWKKASCALLIWYDSISRVYWLYTSYLIKKTFRKIKERRILSIHMAMLITVYIHLYIICKYGKKGRYLALIGVCRLDPKARILDLILQ